jgi:hypothetical protein
MAACLSLQEYGANPPLTSGESSTATGKCIAAHGDGIQLVVPEVCPATELGPPFGSGPPTLTLLPIFSKFNGNREQGTEQWFKAGDLLLPLGTH